MGDYQNKGGTQYERNDKLLVAKCREKTFVFREKSDSEKAYKKFEFDTPPKQISVKRFSRKGEKLLNMAEDTALELAKMGIF